MFFKIVFFFEIDRKKIFKTFFLRKTLAFVFLVLGLGLEHSCPWSRIFFVSLALASSLVSSTPPLFYSRRKCATKIWVFFIVYHIYHVFCVIYNQRKRMRDIKKKDIHERKRMRRSSSGHKKRSSPRIGVFALEFYPRLCKNRPPKCFIILCIVISRPMMEGDYSPLATLLLVAKGPIEKIPDQKISSEERSERPCGAAVIYIIRTRINNILITRIIP